MTNPTPKQPPSIIGIGGLTSNVGKTTLVCELLKHFPGWEAIKTTRGHYRSCGKDPHTCCVSHLLTDEPIVRSGYETTYAEGKDTGRYWDAGASNVHWLIATDDQIEKGIAAALSRVNAAGVFVEGNSFTEFLEPDYFIMVARADSDKIKTTARRAIERVNAIYVSTPGSHDIESLNNVTKYAGPVSIFTAAELLALVNEIRAKIYSINGGIRETDQALCAS